MKNNKLTNETEQPNIPTINYEAIEYLGWFNSDVQNVQSLGNGIFRGGMSIGSPQILEMKTALNKALDEVTDDVNQLRVFLNNINNVNKI